DRPEESDDQTSLARRLDASAANRGEQGGDCRGAAQRSLAALRVEIAAAGDPCAIPAARGGARAHTHGVGRTHRKDRASRLTGHAGRARPAAPQLMICCSLSAAMMICAASSGDPLLVSTITSALSGASYGESMPVKFLILPSSARA